MSCANGRLQSRYCDWYMEIKMFKTIKPVLDITAYVCCFWLSFIIAVVSLEAVSGDVTILPSGEIEIVEPLYTLRVDPAKHMATRIEYTVRGEDVRPQSTRNWYTPEDLQPYVLESDDYTGSVYDRGHLRPLALSGGSEHWKCVNNTAAIVPQVRAINRGKIRLIEELIGELATEHGRADVTIEIEFEPGKLQLQRADEPHEVPSAFVYRVRSGGTLTEERIENR